MGLFPSRNKWRFCFMRGRNYTQRLPSWEGCWTLASNWVIHSQNSLDQEKLPLNKARAFDPESQLTSTFSQKECLRVPHSGGISLGDTLEWLQQLSISVKSGLEELSGLLSQERPLCLEARNHSPRRAWDRTSMNTKLLPDWWQIYIPKCHKTCNHSNKQSYYIKWLCHVKAIITLRWEEEGGEGGLIDGEGTRKLDWKNMTFS